MKNSLPTSQKVLQRMLHLSKFSDDICFTSDDVSVDRFICNKLNISWFTYTQMVGSCFGVEDFLYVYQPLYGCYPQGVKPDTKLANKKTRKHRQPRSKIRPHRMTGRNPNKASDKNSKVPAPRKETHRKPREQAHRDSRDQYVPKNSIKTTRAAPTNKPPNRKLRAKQARQKIKDTILSQMRDVIKHTERLHKPNPMTKNLMQPRPLRSGFKATQDAGLVTTDVAQADREYIEACIHPGRKKVIPPFSNDTEIAGIIPLALTSTVYTSRGTTAFINIPAPTTYGVASTALGSSEHTVIALCPAATAFGKGTTNTYASGVVISNVSAPVGSSTPLNYYSLNSFFPMGTSIYE